MKNLGKGISSALLFAFLLFQGCRKTSSHYVKINTYPSGELLSKIPFLKKDSLKDGVYKEYYKNGTLKKTIAFRKGEPVDSAMQYFDTGQLAFKEVRDLDTIYTYYYFKSGEITLSKKFLNRKKPIEIGWSVYYNKNGSVSDSVEHINLSNNSYLNQRKIYNREKELVIDSSNYFKFSLNSIPNSNVFDLKIHYIPLFKKANVFMILGENINDDFSNIDAVETDTIFMKNNEITSKALEKSSRVFKGFFYEYYMEDIKEISEDSVSLKLYEKKTYFNKKVIAKKLTE